jgi:TonB-dependent starch-binding outer membrane protein SusC
MLKIDCIRTHKIFTLETFVMRNSIWLYPWQTNQNQTKQIMMMKKLYAKMSLTAVMLLMSASLVLAQERVVSGTISDEGGAPVPGVNVIVKGTTFGTASDADGKYSVRVPGSDAVLVFSFIGYKTKEMPVGTLTTVDASLEPDVQTLTELVVTGYTTQRKKDITGAVAVVKVDELQVIQAPNIASKLEGRASGVTVSTSGEPGEGTNVVIRGISSFSRGSDPLWIIDGVRSTDKGNNWLNPNDVESIQVLKDASAASIYGTAASNGVIIVTTKKGKAGKTKISYSGYAGVSKPVGGYNDFMIKDPMQMAEAMHQFYANSSNPDDFIPKDNYYYQYELDGTLPDYTWPIGNLTPDGTQVHSIDYSKPVGDPARDSYTNLSDYSYFDKLIMGSNPSGTDWWDELFKTALMTEHNLNLSGGTENSQFNIGTGYLKQEGTMLHTGFDRFTVRANSSFKFGKFTMGENITFAKTKRIAQIGANQDNQNAITMTLLQHTITPVYDIAGNFAGAKALSNGGNPVGLQIRNKDNENNDYKIFGNVFGEFAFTNWLKFRSNLGVNYGSGVYTGFSFPTPENREPTTINAFNENWRTSFNWQWSNTVEFSKKIGDAHQLSVLAGYEAIKGTWRTMDGRLNNYFSQEMNGWYLNSGLADPATRVVNSNGAPNTLVSLFGKVDYTFNDKYLFSATVRRDGSSRFAEAERWGVFPAGSVGWRVSGEPFMAGVAWINDLKLRAGYGVTGNENIDAGNPFAQYGGSPGGTFYDINGNGGLVTGYALTKRGNPNSKWESTTTTNIGLDLTMFDDKLSLVVDVYERKVEDLLYQLRIAGTAGSATPAFTNVGDMTNKGIDVNVDYRGRLSDELSFNVGVAATHYKNEVLFINPDQDFFYSTGADGHANYVINKVGHPFASFYGYKYLGVYKSADEATNGPDQSAVGGNRAGGLHFADLDGDGIVSADKDRSVIGNPHPDLTLGINLGLNYKAFDFNMFLFASIGNDIYNYQRYYYEFGRWGSMFSKAMLTDSWSEERPNASLPALNIDNQASGDLASSYYIEDGSYLRARTMQLGYNVPTSGLGKIGVSRLRVYVQAQNLFTITGYSGVDPVLSNVNIGDGDANDQYLGTDLGNYPSSRIYSLGVNLDF